MRSSKRLRRGEPIFCDKCGRVTFRDQNDHAWWLIGNGVVRCPQHITEWTLRKSGKGRSMDSFRFKRLARENDRYDPALEVFEPLMVLDDVDW